ncbi:unnamed protein product [Rhizophagus irregularis]|uniref:Uncharacterized protein n=1 Tax=Rhizophagus irregularis TaxID=588596 RepID=A0A915YZ43_9GLOM|nr:hypothetical protein GLOIN_2v1469455 [Rhizophagus irregularis DAOM 181602=DAOM 197198]CAB4479942.1 unnamed protein product [Rhizophagus irregularis]CAB5355660.1 unnamed protein product [Rhizophagus irregularis]
MALNLEIASNSHQVFENLLQQFIEQQTLSLSAQDDDLTEEFLEIKIRTKFRKDQERKTSGNVLYVSHGIMTREIALQKIKNKIKKIFR